MEEVRQLISSRQARILKSMTDSRAEQASQVTESEEQEKKKKATAAEKPETAEQQERRRRLAESDARRSLERVRPPKEGEPSPRKLQEMTLDELYAEYDHWERLEQRLKKYSHDEVLLGDIKIQTEQVRRELLLHGGVPRKDLQALAEMPVAYSATLLNDLAQSAIGISVQGDSKDGNISIDASGIHVPEGPLTLEHTLEIARMLTQEHSELLRGKEAELAEFGQKIRELATYLAGQTKDGKGKESIFATEEQKQAIVQLYNAGVWLSKLGKTTTEQVDGQQKPIKNIEEWGELEGRGRKYLQGLSKEKEADVLEFLFGKGLAKGRIPTSYERLLQHHGGSPEALRQWLQGHGSRMVRLLAPHIAESFAQEGRAATAIVRGVARGADAIVPQVVFEQAKERTAGVGLPTRALDELRARGIPLPDAERQLVAAARQLRSSDVFARMPLERRLEELNRMVQSFQAPHETSGDTVRGYKLAEVFDNVDAELGCSLRAYLLARLINEVYQDVPESQRPSVTANTLLLPNANGVIGHTRLMVADPSLDQVFVVDPSVQRNTNSAMYTITSRELAEQVRQVALTGKSANIFVPQEEGEVVVKHQIIGDAITAQEANMLANIAAAVAPSDNRESDQNRRQQLLQMALQRDPNNQMALLHLAAIADQADAKVYLDRLQQLNQGLTKDQIQTMLAAGEHPEKFQVAFTTTSITDKNLRDQIEHMFGSSNIDRNSFLERYALIDRGAGLSPIDIAKYRQALLQLANQTGVSQADRDAIVNGLIPELDAAISKEGIQVYIQRQLQQIEKDAATPTGFTQLEGNYQTSNALRNFVNSLDAGMYGQEYINQLRAELHVRTAGHDIAFLGRLKGDSGVQQMVEAANRFTTDEYLEVEALPGVALVRRLYEQETGHFLAEKGGIGPNDFDTIRDSVNARFEELRLAGAVGELAIGQLNGLNELERQEIDRATTVGRNLFIIKTRIAHFIAYGDPTVTGGALGIGNAPWDFLTRIYSPYTWMMERYGTIPHHAKPLVDSIGKDKINRLLYLQDHDSSVWRIPTFLEQFDSVLGHHEPDGTWVASHKQALFMRLYWLGEPFNVEQFLEHHGRNGRAELEAQRRALVQDIIRYVPEELASVFRDTPEMRALLGNANYQQFLTDIMRARESCIANGDYEYANFDANLQTNPNSYVIYQELTRFLQTQASHLADINYEFTFEKPPAHGEAHGKKYKLINPLYGQRVLSLADAPFELIDKLVMRDNAGQVLRDQQGRIRRRLNTALSNKLGGQDVGREWNSVSDASKAMGAVAKYLGHPSIEHLGEVVGVFAGYKGWEHDEKVRDALFAGLLDYVAEDKKYRLLMPGLDRLVSGGKASKMQRLMGKTAEADPTAELRAMIKQAEGKGLITPKAAAELLHKLDPYFFFSLPPLIQIFIVVLVSSLFRTALSPKALLG